MLACKCMTLGPKDLLTPTSLYDDAYLLCTGPAGKAALTSMLHRPDAKRIRLSVFRLILLAAVLAVLGIVVLAVSLAVLIVVLAVLLTVLVIILVHVLVILAIVCHLKALLFKENNFCCNFSIPPFQQIILNFIFLQRSPEDSFQ